MTSIGDRIRTLRQTRKHSQAELARLLGINQATIAGYESDRYQPSVTTLIDIANIYGVSVDYLVGVVQDDIDDDLVRAIKALSPTDRIAARKIIAALADRGKIHPQPSADGLDDSTDDSPATGNNKSR